MFAFCRRILIIGAVVALTLSTAGYATPAAAASSQTKSVTVNIKGTASAPKSNACPTIDGADTYTDQCVGSGPGGCSCVEISGATVTGSAGTGTADVFITEDTIINVPSGSNTAVCTPVLGNANLTTMIKGTQVSNDLDFQGTLCVPPLTKNGKNPINGGFGIASSPQLDATGYGVLTGSLADGSNAVQLQFRGPVTFSSPD